MTDTPLTAEEQALIEIVRLLPAESQDELRADIASMAADALAWERHRALSTLCQFLVPKPAPVKHLLVAKKKLDAAEATIATLTTRVEQAEAQRDRAETTLEMVKALADGYGWLAEGRGPYEYDDGRYDDDVRTFASQLHELLPSGNWLGFPEWEAKYRMAEERVADLEAALEVELRGKIEPLAGLEDACTCDTEGPLSPLYASDCPVHR